MAHRNIWFTNQKYGDLYIIPILDYLLESYDNIWYRI
jgi:hypothetical protein